MVLRMSANGRARLIQREGSKTRAYRDSVGVWTIGVGHTSAAGAPRVRPGLVITKAQVDEILSRDLAQYEAAVRSVVHVPLTQGQFDALVSFCFNIGVGAFAKSTVVKRLAAADYEGAANALLLWNKPREIIGRRESERAQFLEGTGGVGPSAAKIVQAIEVAPPKLQEGEAISADYLRLAGSRTIAGAEAAKQGIVGAVGSAALSTAAASRIPDATGQLQEAIVGIESGVGALEMLRTYWPLLALVALAGAAAWFARRAWRGASLVTAARVEDAVTGVHIGR